MAPKKAQEKGGKKGQAGARSTAATARVEKPAARAAALRARAQPTRTSRRLQNLAQEDEDVGAFNHAAPPIPDQQAPPAVEAAGGEQPAPIQDPSAARVTREQRGKVWPPPVSSGQNEQAEGIAGPSIGRRVKPHMGKRLPRVPEADDTADEDNAEQPHDNASDSSHPEDDGFANVKFIEGAIAETEIPCQFNNNDAILRIQLRVYNDPVYTSRLGHYAQMFLTQIILGDDGADEAVTGNEQEIGYIHAWRIDKPIARLGNQYKTAWIQDFLTVDPTDQDSIDIFDAETAWCLQALYRPQGNLRRGVAGRPRELIDNSLLFVQTVHIYSEFQKNGLLRPSLVAFHQLLTQLPEWYAFAGSIVLVPAAPKGRSGEPWEGMADGAATKKLIAIYKNHGGYELWVDGDRRPNMNRGVLISVMGRTVP